MVETNEINENLNENINENINENVQELVTEYSESDPAGSPLPGDWRETEQRSTVFGAQECFVRDFVLFAAYPRSDVMRLCVAYLMVSWLCSNRLQQSESGRSSYCGVLADPTSPRESSELH